MSRLDTIVAGKHSMTRSKAENLIKMGKVQVNGQTVRKAGYRIKEDDAISLQAEDVFVSRAAYKLKAAVESFGVNFANTTNLDVGISTGGFAEFMLSRGAQKIVGVEVGTNQLHSGLRQDRRIELYEQTDIRDFTNPNGYQFNFVTIDVSFISIREVLPHIIKLTNKGTQIIAMLKPQFEAGDSKKHKGVIKNSKMRRNIIRAFELWLRDYAIIEQKQDSKLSGKKGNVERFYLLKPLQ